MEPEQRQASKGEYTSGTEPLPELVGTSWRPTFTLRTLFKVVLFVCLGLGCLRFLASHPALIVPTMIFAVLLASVLTLQFLINRGTAPEGIALGCIVAPLIYVLATVVLANLLWWLWWSVSHS